MKKNKKKTNKKSFKPVSQQELLAKMVKKNLGTKIDEIYNDEIDLTTNMTCQCNCCKVAMPQIHYSEFLNIATYVWAEFSSQEKIELICKSIEYFFKVQFHKYGKDIFYKPCVFLDKDTNLCKIYDKRPLNCRLYGLWPEDMYNARVEGFAKNFEKFGIKKEDIPLHKQCDKVTRVNNDKPLDKDVIESLEQKLNELDKVVGGYSKTQIKTAHNYRTFHDWILLKIYGEKFIYGLSDFLKLSDKEQTDDLLEKILAEVRTKLSSEGVPNFGE